MGSDGLEPVCSQSSSVEWGLLRMSEGPPTTRGNVATMSHHIEDCEQVEVCGEL
jgi:hypothetical protein